MSIGPVSSSVGTSTVIDQQAQMMEQASTTDATQQAVLDRQEERRAQLEAQLQAQQRVEDRQAALDAYGIQQARLQDAILADQDLQATQEAVQEARADQAVTAEQSFDEAAVNALLNNNGNATIATVQDALSEFGQFSTADTEQIPQVQVTSTVTATTTGSDIDTRL
ncbi:hypothetical protein [Kineosporia succinea]|uniref:Multidrug efflux pump subunit AcrA (Membrane-fusion protein) n=1 Tax=Kineosporia succinea TaxID=84632 RepID=A0ABT9PCN7_9ACTN|nr:hypothetical protein [Kineosporia succinea]MDP9830469.1 multidrug efflux pump subunit AcrA (membrane-fusion protein) [Kineosporia succinea]